MPTIKLKTIDAPPPTKLKEPPFKPLSGGGYYRNTATLIQLCQSRKLPIVINTVDDGRIVAAIEDSVGVAKSLHAALERAARVWDKDNKQKPKKPKKKAKKTSKRKTAKRNKS